MKRKFDSVAKMKKQEDGLEQDDKLVSKVNRKVLFSAPTFDAATQLKYSDLPQGAGPPYPRNKPPRPHTHAPRKG